MSLNTKSQFFFKKPVSTQNMNPVFLHGAFGQLREEPHFSPSVIYSQGEPIGFDILVKDLSGNEVPYDNNDFRLYVKKSKHADYHVWLGVKSSGLSKAGKLLRIDIPAAEFAENPAGTYVFSLELKKKDSLSAYEVNCEGTFEIAYSAASQNPENSGRNTRANLPEPTQPSSVPF